MNGQKIVAYFPSAHTAMSMDPSFLSALRAGDIDRLRKLIQDDPGLLYGNTVKGNSALHIAASHGNIWAFTQAFNLLDINFLLHQNAKGDTALHCAARAGQDNIVAILIGHYAGGLMTGVLNDRGDAALHEAARGGHVNAVWQLMAIGPDMAAVVNRDGESPLYLAAAKGSVEAVRMLLGCLTVEYGGPEGQTALHAAACRSYDIAEMLLEKMPELNQQVDASQSAPIHYAASLGDVSMVRLLLEGDASVAHLLDNHGMSAIHIAATLPKKMAFAALILGFRGGFNRCKKPRSGFKTATRPPYLLIAAKVSAAVLEPLG